MAGGGESKLLKQRGFRLQSMRLGVIKAQCVAHAAILRKQDLKAGGYQGTTIMGTNSIGTVYVDYEADRKTPDWGHKRKRHRKMIRRCTLVRSAGINA